MEGCCLTVSRRKARRPIGKAPGSWMDPGVVVGKEVPVPVEEGAGTAQQCLA